MNGLNFLRVELTEEEMSQISGGKKTFYEKTYYYEQVDCPEGSDDYRVCFNEWTTTTEYEVNIWGKAKEVGSVTNLDSFINTY